MPLQSFTTDLQWTFATLTGGAHPFRSALVLAPHSLSPNRGWRDIDADGNATGWILEQGVKRVGHHHYASRAGNRPAGPTVPLVEQGPPRRDTLVRQTPLATALGQAWSAFQSLIYGFTPTWLGQERSELPQPLAPGVEVISTGKGGFADDTYGIRIDLRVHDRKAGHKLFKKDAGRSLPSGWTYIPVSQMATGNYFRVFVGDLLGGPATHVGVYVTRPGSGGAAGTERLCGVYELARAADTGYVDVTGPYDDNGKRPATKDESGIGKPLEPLFRKRPGRFAILRKKGNHGDIQPGSYWFAIQIFDGTGWSLVGYTTHKVEIEDEIKGEAFYFVPPNLPAHWRWRPWVQYEPKEGGSITWLSGYHGPRNTQGLAGSFGDFRGPEPEDVSRSRDPRQGADDKHDKWGVEFYGYIAEAEPSGLKDRFASNTPPPPEEDGTALEPPDANSGPDAVAVGPSFPDSPADYLVATSDEDELVHESAVSNTTLVALTAGNLTWRQKPTLRTNLIRNAEGSERNSDGEVIDWSGMAATATATATFADGILQLSAISSGSATLTPKPTTARVPVSDQDNVTFMATMFAQNPLTGSLGGGGQLVVHHYAAGGTTPLATTVLLTLTTAQLVTLRPGGTTMGPLGTAWAAGTEEYEVQLRPNPTGGNFNMRLFMRDLCATSGIITLRKFETIGPAQPINFAPNAGVSYPGTSAHAVGPVAEAETAAPPADPPIYTEDFEDGALADFTLRTPPSGGNASFAIEAAAALAGGLGLRVQDTTTNSIKERIWVYTLASSTATELHFRWLDKAVTLPTRGELIRGWITDTTDKAMLQVRYSSNGQLRLYRYKADGTLNSSYTIGVSGLVAGQSLDCEFGVVGGNTNGGAIRLLVGLNGNPRTEVARVTSQDFTARFPKNIYFGGRETDSGSKWNFYADNLAITSTGYVLNPEQPTPVTPIVPDAPIRSTGPTAYRLFDAEDQSINQWWWHNEQDVPLGELRGGPRTQEAVAVIPGRSYVNAVQMAWEHTSTTDDPVHQFAVLLTGLNKRPLLVGSPFGPGPDATLCARAGGARSTATGMAASGDWSATPGTVSEDYWQQFTVPSRESALDPGYTQMWILPVNAQSGVFAAQEHDIFRLEELTALGGNTQANRDALRDYGRAEEGSATLTFDTWTPEGTAGHNMPLREAIAGQAVVQSRADLPAGVELQNILWRAADTLAGLATATPTADPATLPDSRYRRVSFDMVGDGVEGPEVASGGAYVFTKPWLSQVLREDRSEFTGGTFVDGVEAVPERSEYEVAKIQGNYTASARSAPVRLLNKTLRIHVFAEEGKLELEATRPTDILGLEARFINGEGEAWQIQPGQEINVVTDPNSVLIREAEERLKRYVHGVAEVTQAKVIAAGPLR